MTKETFIDTLLDFNLSRQEATVYQALLIHGAMTGYEVSKETGVSRSNVYAALNLLTEKGASYLIEGDVTKYTPVELKTFLQNRMFDLQKKSEFLIQNSPKKIEQEEGYITIIGSKNIAHKIRAMLNNTELRLYMMASSKIINEFSEELLTLANESKKIVLITNNYELKNAKVYKTDVEEGQLRLITDSNFVLTGNYTGDVHDTCLYSGQTNLVQVLKEALKNKIELLNKTH